MDPPFPLTQQLIFADSTVQSLANRLQDLQEKKLSRLSQRGRHSSASASQFGSHLARSLSSLSASVNELGVRRCCREQENKEDDERDGHNETMAPGGGNKCRCLEEIEELEQELGLCDGESICSGEPSESLSNTD